MNKSLEQYMPDGSKLPYRFMKYRIHKILLVCCSYDGYILEEDGHIESQINQEYIDLNMSTPPSLTRVSSTPGGRSSREPTCGRCVSKSRCGSAPTGVRTRA